MRKHVLLFAHGMGSYVKADGSRDDTWSKKAEDTLKQQYEKYEIVSLVPFEDRFDVVHINYDTEFHKIVTRWANESGKVLSGPIPDDADVKKLLTWLQGGAKLEDNFSWTHASDVILYRFFELVRQRIKIHVANQIHAALAPNLDGAVTAWSAIAHSLGTIVIHDVLHALDHSTPNEAGISIIDSMVPSASVVAMVANVSKILETHPKVYESHVVPPSLVQKESVCFNYMSFHNKFDPFTRPKPFDPAGVPAWDLALANETFRNVEPENIHELNVHSIENYLVNPHVHIPLLEALCGAGSISASERQAAIDRFEDVPDTLKKQALEELQQELEGKSWFQKVGEFIAKLDKINE